MKCVICDRERSGERDYCELHKKAHDSVVEKYEMWHKASGIFWKEYLSEIVKNPLTGEWAREVAEYLLEQGEK